MLDAEEIRNIDKHLMYRYGLTSTWLDVAASFGGTLCAFCLIAGGLLFVLRPQL